MPYLGATERPAPLCTTCRRRAAAGRGRLLEPGVAAHEPRAVGVRRQPFQSVGPEVPEERGGGGRILTFTYGIFKYVNKHTEQSSRGTIFIFLLFT